MENCWIPAGVGGFTVLQRSHIPVYYSMGHEYHYEPVQPEHDALMRRLIKEATPLETTAHKGDCVFYHHRIVHSAGVNRTGFTDNPRIRKAALCDFMRSERPMKEEL